MKSIILGKEERKTVLLCEDGTFRKTIFHSKEPKGGTVDYDNHFVKKAASCVACICLAVLIGVSNFAFSDQSGFTKENKPVTTVNTLDPVYSIYFDANPSFVIDLNTEEKVIDARALSEGGESFVKTVKIGADSEQTIKNLLNLFDTKGYDIKEDGSAIDKIFITIASNNEKLCATKIKELSDKEDKIAIKGFTSNFQDAKTAEKMGFSIGKLYAAQKIAEHNGETSIDKYLELSIKELSKLEEPIPDNDKFNIIKDAFSPEDIGIKSN